MVRRLLRYNPEVFRSRAKTIILAGVGAAACGWIALSRDPMPRPESSTYNAVRSAPQRFALTDSAQDGTPDFLRLQSREDRQSFRNWFCYLAEHNFFVAPKAVPEDVADCSGLVRFAYRETLRRHDGNWATRIGLKSPPAIPSIRQYTYPETPLRASLLRVRAGIFRPENLEDGTFAQFADAQTLVRRNCHFVTRDIARAKPGDLVLYRQRNPHQPFHLMVYLGPSHMDESAGPYVVYHTGEIGKSAGEVRRPTVRELLSHPLPQWRPVESNDNFLGVFRWNILRWESELE